MPAILNRPACALAAMLVLGLVVPTALPSAAFARSSGTERTLKMVDTDKDGTIDLAEAQAAAGKVFDAAETDKDGTVDAKELKGRVSKTDLKAADTDNDGTLDAKELNGLLTPAELKAADPDSDGTLDKKEYLAVVAARFKAADPDAEGTIDAKELSSPAGVSLATLMK